MEKNTISIQKKIAEKPKNIEVTGDVIVPDTKPDIVSIIGTNANPYIYKEECQDGKYRFDGNVDARIVYLSDNGETKCIQTTLDFMDGIEDASMQEQTTTKYRIEIESIDAKILNERKINICVHLKIYFQFFECQDMEYMEDLDTLSGVEKLEETVTLNTMACSNKIKTSLKEDIKTDETDSIAEILKSDIEITNLEDKMSYNKVLSKADVNIRILYVTENATFGTAEMTVPMMNFIDMENVTDEDTCQMDYKVRNMLFKVNSTDGKSISCQIDFEISCEAYNQKTIHLVQDMYGIDRNITFTQKTAQVQIGFTSQSQIVNISENILVEDIRSLYDVACSANMTNKTQAGNSWNYEGEVCLTIYFDTGNNLGIKTAKIPFMVKLDCDTDNIRMTFVKKDFKLNNEDVSCDMDLEITPNSNQYKTIHLIDTIEEEECENDNDDYAMIVYFVKDGDTIWNIARDFRVTTDSIIQNNNLEENQKINIGEKLYIVK